MDTDIERKIKDATEEVWELCRGRKKCPRERVEKQFEWIASAQEKVTRQELRGFLEEVDINIVHVIVDWLETQGQGQDIQGVANGFREILERLKKKYEGE